MPKIKMIEIAVGMFVAAGIAALFMLAMKVSNLSSFAEKDGYTLTARFENIGGLKTMSPVNAGGVRIGRVTAISYDQEDFEAGVSLVISQKDSHFPGNTSASIYTSGLLGELYISLEPGGDEEYLKAGDEIELTQSAFVMEQVIGQFIFSKAAEGSSE